MPIPLAAALVLSSLPAAAGEVQEMHPKELPLAVRIPEEAAGRWEITTFPSALDAENFVQAIRGPKDPLTVVGSFVGTAFQVDLGRADPAALRAILSTAEPDADLSALVIAPEEREGWGTVATLSGFQVKIGDAPVLDGRAAFFPAQDGLVVVLATGPSGTTELTASVDDVAGWVAVDHPAVSRDALGWGKVTLESGYSVELPENFRAMGREEMKGVDSKRILDGPYKNAPITEIFVDPSSVEDPRHFACSAQSSDRTMEVVDPQKSERHGRNYRARARALLRGAGFTTADGKHVDLPRVSLLPGSKVDIDKGVAGDLEFLSIGDREAFLWRADATFQDKPVKAATFYTSWDNVTLDCSVLQLPGQEGLVDAFLQAVRTVRVTDGGAHPMELSWRSQYLRWWPYSHPALQLYWVVVPVALLAGWMALRQR